MSETKIGILDRLILTHEGSELAQIGEPIDKLLTSSFDSTFISLKVIFIMLFVILAFMNKYLKFIKNNPKTYIIETVVYGVCGAIPFLFMEKYRRETDAKKYYLSMFFGMFLLYAFFNIVFEIGGLYVWLYGEVPKTESNTVTNEQTSSEANTVTNEPNIVTSSEPTTVTNEANTVTNEQSTVTNEQSTVTNEQSTVTNVETNVTNNASIEIPVSSTVEGFDNTIDEGEVISVLEQTNIYNNIFNSVNITVALVLGYMILSMIVITFRVHDFKIEGYGESNFKMFSFETLLFGLCNSLPFFLVAYNREKSRFKFSKNAIEVGLLFVKFVILHLLLQGSGFYKHSIGY